MGLAIKFLCRSTTMTGAHLDGHRDDPDTHAGMGPTSRSDRRTGCRRPSHQGMDGTGLRRPFGRHYSWGNGSPTRPDTRTAARLPRSGNAYASAYPDAVVSARLNDAQAGRRGQQPQCPTSSRPEITFAGSGGKTSSVDRLRQHRLVSAVRRESRSARTRSTSCGIYASSTDGVRLHMLCRRGDSRLVAFLDPGG